MAASEFEIALEQIVEEKGLSKQEVIGTIGAAIAAAYRKDFGERGQNVEGEFDPETMHTRLFDVKDVVETEEEMEKPEREILLADAKKIDADVEVGGQIRTEIEPPADMEFGRIAAQTAKQVITQRLREAEREMVVETYSDRIGEILNGSVQRIERGVIYVDLGQANGVLYPSEQVRFEHYNIGERIKVYLVEVRTEGRGPELILSRTHPDMVQKLFEMECPEVASGAVQLKGIAREPGSRAKVAVWTDQEEIDPVGSCVGQRGSRVQAVIAELGGEKIDIIEWDENPVTFISNALSPARVISVKLNEENKHAIVEVDEDQLSLAIGREGQNVRLAVRLTGWKIDVVKEGEEPKTAEQRKAEREAKLAEEAGEQDAEAPEAAENAEEATEDVSAEGEVQGTDVDAEDTTTEDGVDASEDEGAEESDETKND